MKRGGEKSCGCRSEKRTRAPFEACNCAPIQVWIGAKMRCGRSITVGFSQDGPGNAIPKGDFRAGILGSERWEAPSCGIQVLETLRCEVLTVCVQNQNVVSGVQREANFSRHDANPPRGRAERKSFQFGTAA